jgi:hypothetical protein
VEHALGLLALALALGGQLSLDRQVVAVVPSNPVGFSGFSVGRWSLASMPTDLWGIATNSRRQAG